MLKTKPGGKALAGRLAIITAVITALLVFPGTAVAAIQNDRVLESGPVAEGLILQKREATINGGGVLVYVLKADLTNPYLKINTLVGAGGNLDKNARVADMAASAGAVAAVNADFFQMAESGRPIGMTYKEGRLVTSPPLRNDMPGWALTGAGVPLIEVFSFSGKVTARSGAQFPLSGINKPSYIQSGEKNSHDNTLLMYDRFWGQSSRGRIDEKDNVTEVFVSSGVVTEILVNKPGKAIPGDGYVLAARGSAAEFVKSNIKAGDKVTVEYKVTPEGDKIWAGTGGWSLLVDQGRATGNYPADINGYNARTAVGFTQDRKALVVVVVEKSAASRGVTLNELSEYLVSLGVYRALNLDGGGSTTLAARPLGEEKPALVNQTQRDAQRLVPTAIGFFTTAPRGSLAGLTLKGPKVLFPGDTGNFEARGYDSHYNPYPLSRESLSWSLVSGPGSLAGGVFTAVEGGTPVISAKSGGFSTTATLRVLGPRDLKSISVNPKSITVRPGGTVEITVTAVGLDDSVYTLAPRNYSVSAASALGRLENSVFKAAGSPAEGQITISFGDLSTVVPVAVRLEDQSAYKHSPGQPGMLTLGDLSLGFTGGAFNGPVSVSAAYGGELLNPIAGRYKSVSSVTVRAEGEGAASLSDPAALTWKFRPGEGGRLAVLHLTGNGWQEVPSRVDNKENQVFCRIWELGALALVRDDQPPAGFSDLAGHWAAGPVSRLATAGVVSGYPGNTFAPARQITRAEFIVMICKALGWRPVQGDGRFRDAAAIPGWSGGYVQAAANRGVVTGYEDNTFRPSNQVTRTEMAVMISRALSLQPGENIKLSGVFSDGGTIPAWAEKPVTAVYGAGIIKGDSSKKFRPGEKATRAESAAMIDSMLNYLWISRN